MSTIFLIFQQDLRFAQSGADAHKSSFIGTDQRVKVDPSGQIREGVGIGGLTALNKLLNLVAVGELQRTGQLTVNRMLHNDILHNAAVVNQNTQLCFHTGGIVAAGDLPHKSYWRMLDHIAARRGGNFLASCPQQGDVAHNDLTADGKTAGQSGGADGLLRIFQRGKDHVTTLFCLHINFLLWCLDKSIAQKAGKEKRESRFPLRKTHGKETVWEYRPVILSEKQPLVFPKVGRYNVINENKRFVIEIRRHRMKNISVNAVTNLYTIVEKLAEAGKVVKP